ncbi:hypothetical protein KM043_016267 [Ampulex compressa]|nr:hypothetical protein KM043_016267 [Ampulex compressa]
MVQSADETCDERSKVSLRNILQATGATEEDAERAATIIQTAFRGHLERMALEESQGIIQWQKAVGNTLSILKKAGVSRTEITKATSLIKFAYSGYYTRRNRKIQHLDQELDEIDKDEAIQTIQAVAWMEMMYEDSGLTMQRANEAALVIQGSYDVQKLESTKSMVVEAILENLRLRLFKKVMSREDIPEEYGTRDDMIRDSLKLQTAFKDHLRRTRMSEEDDPDELQEKLSKSDAKADEDSIKPEMDDKAASEVENNLQRFEGDKDLKSESARELQTALNLQLSKRAESTPDVPINAEAPTVGEEEKDEEQGYKEHEEQKAPPETTITDDTAA